MDASGASALAVEIPGVRGSVNDLAVESMAIVEHVVPAELYLLVAEVDDTLVATFNYQADLFDRETVERMAGHLRRLLAAAAHDPASPVSDLPLLSEAEEQTLARERSQAPVPFEDEACVHELFERQASDLAPRVRFPPT